MFYVVYWGQNLCKYFFSFWLIFHKLHVKLSYTVQGILGQDIISNHSVSFGTKSHFKIRSQVVSKLQKRIKHRVPCWMPQIPCLQCDVPELLTILQDMLVAQGMPLLQWGRKASKCDSRLAEQSSRHGTVIHAGGARVGRHHFYGSRFGFTSIHYMSV